MSNRTEGSGAHVKLKRKQRSVKNQRDDAGGDGCVFRFNPAGAGIVGRHLIREQLCNPDFEFRTGCTENSVFYFTAALGSVHPRTAISRIDHPDITDAEVEEIVDLLLHAILAIVFGENFDAD